ncbi:hypothetical protein N0V90_001120 [Kalmusia sp. IMI 367209]|nr:hypothetical protein N0V90_001120 [Kalmusia sp. IMI 367209]
MRLLYHREDGKLSVTADLVDADVIPPYAILSHTWGADEEEVTFDNLAKNAGKDKPGYKKIQLCGEQAKRDGLQHFWVDTCCINKANKAELSLAIRSMFRWYRNAARCYVYLPDVSDPPIGVKGEVSQALWHSEFRESKWFTRGWTLQELLAPALVEFFSHEWHRLGNRVSLKSQIHEVTSIPHEVLEGAPLSQSSVDERFRWRQGRQTKLKEDAAYSLSGIFDVDMAPVYGEGTEEAFRRLHDKIRSREECLRDLCSTDPRNDKKRIEDLKGGLLDGSYHWVLDNSSFQQWHNDPQSQLLWIKGDPGKGKTMLLCGIINDLQKTVSRTTSVSYFFCQATDSRINSATAVLRGLLYLLVGQQPALTAHVRKRHDQAGKAVFEDANAWIALTEIFADVLQDPNLDTTYILIDALDECVSGLSNLLDFVVEQSSASARVKWIVSSRNWPSIEEQLEQAGHLVRLSLELNAETVSAAVGVFVHHKVSQLARQKKYDEQTRDAVFKHLTLNADGTFLWVALVSQDLEKTAKRNVLKRLNSFPPGLNALYERMMQHIGASDDADVCKRVLAIIALVYRPITLKELVAVADSLEDVTDELELREIIGLCGSFLALRKDAIYFVHHSAKDFLLAKAFADILPNGNKVTHRAIFVRSLAMLFKTLHKDMYRLEAPSTHVNDIKPPDPDPLAASRYLCIYWIDHLLDSVPESGLNIVGDLQVLNMIDNFIKEKFLYWLEGLSLCKSMAKGVVSMSKLCSLVQGTDELVKHVEDACRFVMYHSGVIESFPLQTYNSALLFSPTESIIRMRFQHEEPRGIIIKPAMNDGWTWLASTSYDKTIKIWDVYNGACLHTLQGHRDTVHSVAFSHDSAWLASASDDETIKIWDANSGACMQTFKGHRGRVASVAFSYNSVWLASASSDKTVKIWDPGNNVCLRTLRGHTHCVKTVAFSRNSVWLASASLDKTVKIWDAHSGACLQTLKGHSSYVRSVTFSHDSSKLASASDDMTAKLWAVSSGACLQVFRGHSATVNSVAYSYNSAWLASASDDNTVRIWNTSSSVYLQTIKGHRSFVTCIASSHDSSRTASASSDKTVKIWDLNSGACLQTLKGHSASVHSVAFSYNSAWLASASYDETVKIWDTKSGVCLQTLKSFRSYVCFLVFSRNSSKLASVSDEKTIMIWHTNSGACLQTLECGDTVRSVAFSNNSMWLASASDSGTVQLWDVNSGACLKSFIAHISYPTSISFSHNSAWLASTSYDKTIKIWDVYNGACLHTLQGHSDTIYSVTFSHDSSKLASASDDETVKLWSVRSGACLQTLNVGKALKKISFDSTDFCLCTEIGTIIIHNTERSSGAAALEPEVPRYLGTNLSADNMWIKHASKNLLWLPSEYRPSCSSVCGSTVAMGVGSGRVWMCSVIDM